MKKREGRGRMERKGLENTEEGEEFVNVFLKKENISKCVYQGCNSFEGTQARKLLKKVNELEEAVMKLDPVKIQKTLPFVATLGMFNKVVESCFGQNLDPKYKEFIKTFSQQYRTLKI